MNPSLRPILQAISAVALLGTILPSVLYFVGSITLPHCTTLMLITTIIWFVVTPLWMGRAPESADSSGT